MSLVRALSLVRAPPENGPHRSTHITTGMFAGISTYIPGCWFVGAAFSNTGVEAGARANASRSRRAPLTPFGGPGAQVSRSR